MSLLAILWIIGISIAIPTTYWVFSTPHWWRDEYDGRIKSTVPSPKLKTRGEMIMCYIVSLLPVFNLIYTFYILGDAGCFDRVTNWLSSPINPK